MALTTKQCQNAKPQEKPYKLADSGGLYLLINPNGSKYWRLKYRYLGKEKLMALSTFPTVSLADARQGRDRAKKLLAAEPPIDPMMHKQDARDEAARNAQNSFKAVALEWHENQKDRWSEGYAQKNMRVLEMNIFPHIGNRPIATITPPQLLDCLRKVETRGALDIALKTKQICGMVFRYGIQTGRCERDAAADLKGALKTRKTSHYAALEADDITRFMDALGRQDATIKKTPREFLKDAHGNTYSYPDR